MKISKTSKLIPDELRNIFNNMIMAGNFNISSNPTSSNEEETTKKNEEYRGYLDNVDTDVKNIITNMQGRISFGELTDGKSGESVSGECSVVSDTGNADTEFTIAHNVGAVPLGFIVTNIDKGGVVYDSGTTWTSTNIYLKCTTANTNVTLFLLK